jgi:flagellar assembly factor FliW
MANNQFQTQNYIFYYFKKINRGRLEVLVIICDPFAFAKKYKIVIRF